MPLITKPKHDMVSLIRSLLINVNPLKFSEVAMVRLSDVLLKGFQQSLCYAIQTLKTGNQQCLLYCKFEISHD